MTPTRLTATRFDSAVTRLRAAIPKLSTPQILVGFERLVAMVGAGHTSINPFFDPALGYHYLPVELYSFRDGIFVRRADSAHAALVGARVWRIGKLSVDEALAAVAPIISHENDQFARAQGMSYLTLPEILVGLGIVSDPTRVPLQLERDGRRETVTLEPAGLLTPGNHEGRQAIDMSRWVDMRPASMAAPLYASHPETRWLMVLPQEHVLYVAFQSLVAPVDSSERIESFIQRLFRVADSSAVSHLVIDVRDNMGGNSYYNRALLLGVIRRVSLDQRGKLFVIIGRRTYSAAQNLVNELEHYTNATFVGEPTGSPPAFFGEHRPLQLPHSKITVNVSTLWWQTQDPTDHRLFVAPQIYAEASSDDYAHGRDPALDAVIDAITRPTFATRLTEAVDAGDTTLARHLVNAFQADPANRYISAEHEVNAAGYDLLRAGRRELAARVFALNVRSFPQSANTYDSLAEALEQLGRRDQAAKMYARALALNPALESSRAGLHRLGVQP